MKRAVEPPRHKVRFLVDEMLGKLAKNLRMMGLDAELVRGGRDPEVLVERAAREGRYFLTRRSLKVKDESNIIHVVFNDPESQTVEVLTRSGCIPEREMWFTRCIICNELLSEMSWEDAKEIVPEYVAQVHREFRHCKSCGKVYWPGTHRRRMTEAIERWIGLTMAKDQK
jgi:hypothetical protein